MVDSVGDGPVRVGDAVRSQVGFRGEERIGDVTHVSEADITRELQDTVDHGSSLEGTHDITLGTGEVHLGGNLDPVHRRIAVAHGDGVTGVLVGIRRDDTVVARIRVREIIGHLPVVGNTAEREAVVLGQAGVEEVADVVRDGLVVVDQLLLVPDRTVHLTGTVELRTPGTVLDEGLRTVPTLTEVVLELVQQVDLTGLDTTVVFDGEVTVGIGLTALGRHDDDTVSGTGTVEGRSGRTLQDGHALDVIRGDVGDTAGGHRVTLRGDILGGQRNSVDDVQRLVATVDGAETADGHGVGRTRIGGGRRNLQTGDLTGKGGGDIRGTLADDVLALDRRGGVAEGLLGTGDAHRDDHRLVQTHRILFQDHVNAVGRADRNTDGLHSEEGELQSAAIPDIHGVITVQIGDGSCRSAFHNDRRSRDRITVRIGNGTGNLPVLCVKDCCQDSQKARQKQFYFFHKHKLWLNINID